MRRALILVMLAGCVPTSYSWTPASKRRFPERQKGCAFEVFTSQPERGYDEIGDLKHYNGDVPKTVDEFKKVVAGQVCDLGGDAVIVTRDEKGGITKGSVIYWTQRT